MAISSGSHELFAIRAADPLCALSIVRPDFFRPRSQFPGMRGQRWPAMGCLSRRELGFVHNRASKRTRLRTLCTWLGTVYKQHAETRTRFCRFRIARHDLALFVVVLFLAPGGRSTRSKSIPSPSICFADGRRAPPGAPAYRVRCVGPPSLTLGGAESCIHLVMRRSAMAAGQVRIARDHAQTLVPELRHEFNV